MARAIPSTLHQKFNSVVKEQLINVVVEDNMIAAMTLTSPYIKIDENVVECSFQSLEVGNANFF